MVTKDDIVVLLSNSGGSTELNDIMKYCKRFDITLIGMTRKAKSVLSEASDIKITLESVDETNPVNSPTTSMIMMVAYCDAVITALIKARGFNKDNYKIFHPGGKLGSTLIKVEDLMWTGNKIPLVYEKDGMRHVLDVMTEKGLGCTGVLDSKKNLVGIITDGDLRRRMSNDLLSKTASDIMTRNPVTIEKNMFAAEAINIMNSRGTNNKGITVVFVIDPKLNEELQKENVVGILHMHECIRAGVV
jgi:arabinose-5-phosphate isomerase